MLAPVLETNRTEVFVMAVTAAQVKELRERTGAGMMECKKALVESNGDMEQAVDQLRKSGLAQAENCTGHF